MHCELDALDNFLDRKDELSVIITEEKEVQEGS